MRILMVCLGNICRSPLAEGILREKALSAGLDWVVDSAGTAGYHIGEPPHELSMKVARMHGIDISGHKGRCFTGEDMERFDRVYFMDSENYQDARRIAGSRWLEPKADLLLNVLYPGENRGVPDPWSGTEIAYHKVYDLLDKATDAILAGEVSLNRPL